MLIYVPRTNPIKLKKGTEINKGLLDVYPKLEGEGISAQTTMEISERSEKDVLELLG